MIIKALLALLLLIPSLSWGLMEMKRAPLSISDYLDNGWEIVGTHEESIHLYNKKNKKYIFCEVILLYESPRRRYEACFISTHAGE